MATRGRGRRGEDEGDEATATTAARDALVFFSEDFDALKALQSRDLQPPLASAVPREHLGKCVDLITGLARFAGVRLADDLDATARGRGRVEEVEEQGDGSGGGEGQGDGGGGDVR